MAIPRVWFASGNERVLRARFNDARFFWDVDQKKKLEDRVEDLKSVTFQAKLGSYYEKTQRVVKLVAGLGGSERSALLAKCDLTTDMVKEFTDLQGIVGGLYARAQGESEEVALAIYDHYKPLSMEDAIPSTPVGRILSLADKWDTLVECFRIGMVPTGSRDPFGLRRAAQGMVRIIVEGRVKFDFPGMSPELSEFLRDRVEYYFRDVRGFAYDEIRACMSAEVDGSARSRSAAQAGSRGPEDAGFRTHRRQFQTHQEHLEASAVQRFRVPRSSPRTWARTGTLRGNQSYQRPTA